MAPAIDACDVLAKIQAIEPVENILAVREVQRAATRLAVVLERADLILRMQDEASAGIRGSAADTAIASSILIPVHDFLTCIAMEGWTAELIRKVVVDCKPWEPIFSTTLGDPQDSEPPTIPDLPEASPVSAAKLESTMKATGITDSPFGSADLKHSNRWRAATGKPAVMAGDHAESAAHFLVPTQILVGDLWETVTTFSEGIQSLYQQKFEEKISMPEFVGMLFALCCCSDVEANIILGDVVEHLPLKQKGQAARIAYTIPVYEQQLYNKWNDGKVAQALDVVEALEWWQGQGFPHGGVPTSMFVRALRESGLLSDPNLTGKVEGALVARFGRVFWRRRFLTHFVLPMKGKFKPITYATSTTAAVMEIVFDHAHLFHAKHVSTDEIHVMDDGHADPSTLMAEPSVPAAKPPPGSIDFETGALVVASFFPEKNSDACKALNQQAQFSITIRDVFLQDPQPSIADIAEMSEFLQRHRHGSPSEFISASTIARSALPKPHQGRGFGQIKAHDDREISGDLPWLIGSDFTCDVAIDGLQDAIQPFHSYLMSLPRLRPADRMYAVDLSAAHRPSRIRLGHGMTFALQGGLHVTLGNSTVRFLFRLSSGEPGSPPKCELLECSAGPGAPKRHEVPLEGFHFGAGFGVSESKSITEGIPEARICLQSGAGVATIHGAVWYSPEEAAWLIKDLGGGDTFVEMRPGHAYPMQRGYELVVGGVGFYRMA